MQSATATGEHCPEGWTLYLTPGPKFKGVTDQAGTDMLYYNWVDQFDTFGLGLEGVLDASLPAGFVEGSGTLAYAQTMAFTTLVLFSLFTVFNSRSDERSAFAELFSNAWLWGAVFVSLVLQAAVIYVPLLQHGRSAGWIAWWSLGMVLGRLQRTDETFDALRTAVSFDPSRREGT